MPFVYILRSLKNNRRYIGSTRKSVDKRLKEHNVGSSQWTKQNRPFKIVSQEEFENYSDARKREFF